MEPVSSVENVVVEVHLRGDELHRQMAAAARDGLTRSFKEMPPKYFYDDRGSRLFERITELPEYYPTRAERWILDNHAPDIVAAAEGEELVELGAGSAAKTRVLLDAMRDAGSLRRYVPVDICTEITEETAGFVAAEYPGVSVHGVVCDFERHLELLPPGDRRLIAFLGGTIGNFDESGAVEFLARLRSEMGPGDRLLLGTDLVKSRAVLEAAYDDSAGVTAEFNKNLLHVLNRELEGDFDPAAFEHVAFYDEARCRIDIRLRSLVDQRVRLAALDLEVPFSAGEEMRTEISCKFTRARLERVYREAGLEMTHWFTDAQARFALSLARSV